MQPGNNPQPGKPEEQSGKQVAFGIAAFVFGSILLMLLIKYLTG